MEKAIGLDLGKKTLGIAYNDSLGFVHGIETYYFKAFDYVDAANHIHQVAKEKGIKEFALGLPLHLSGNMSEMANNVMTFKKILESLDPNYKIELIDERLTSVQAHRTLSELNVNHETRKAKVDTYAACEILDTYIRRKGNM